MPATRAAFARMAIGIARSARTYPAPIRCVRKVSENDGEHDERDERTDAAARFCDFERPARQLQTLPSRSTGMPARR